MVVFAVGNQHRDSTVLPLWVEAMHLMVVRIADAVQVMVVLAEGTQHRDRTVRTFLTQALGVW